MSIEDDIEELKSELKGLRSLVEGVLFLNLSTKQIAELIKYSNISFEQLLKIIRIRTGDETVEECNGELCSRRQTQILDTHYIMWKNFPLEGPALNFIVELNSFGAKLKIKSK